MGLDPSFVAMNLVRMGIKALEKYNYTYMRESATDVTQITTSTLPHYKHIYGLYCDDGPKKGRS